MSSEFNHNLAPINLDNYEEYFVLYLDGELSPAQMQAVDEWLVTHPDLKAELDLLLNTKLPEEHFSFDKESLLSHHMPQGSLQEDLLLFIDNELPENKQKLVSFELSSNEPYQQQYRQWMAAKLDASELLPHPNKQELYRYEKRVVFFRPWMRAAAVILLVAGMGGFYWRMQKVVDTPPAGSVAVVKPPQKATTTSPQTGPAETVSTLPGTESPALPQVASAMQNKPESQPRKLSGLPVEGQKEQAQATPQNLVAQNQLPVAIDVPAVATTSAADAQRTIAIDEPTNTKPVLISPTITDQKKIVTSATLVAYNPATPDEQTNASGNDERKGSIKGFFRKATRLIGRKTGLSSDKEDEVLVGAVSLTLK